jgi:hypothetical protein
MMIIVVYSYLWPAGQRVSPVGAGPSLSWHGVEGRGGGVVWPPLGHSLFVAFVCEVCGCRSSRAALSDAREGSLGPTGHMPPPPSPH